MNTTCEARPGMSLADVLRVLKSAKVDLDKVLVTEVGMEDGVIKDRMFDGTRVPFQGSGKGRFTIRFHVTGALSSGKQGRAWVLHGRYKKLAEGVGRLLEKAVRAGGAAQMNRTGY